MIGPAVPNAIITSTVITTIRITATITNIILNTIMTVTIICVCFLRYYLVALSWRGRSSSASGDSMIRFRV